MKLSTGEPLASNYLRPELIKDLIQEVKGTIVECNTTYGGSRVQTAMHCQVAKDHGFTNIADFRILDENGSNIHTGGKGGSMWSADQDAFWEAMAEAGKSVSNYLGNGEGIAYINVMNPLSVDCDGNPAEPDMHDIGILASTDPVALDQACIDLIYSQKDGDGASFVIHIESRNGLHTLEHDEEIGFGSLSYQLIDINE